MLHNQKIGLPGAPGFHAPKDWNALVTGSSGFVGSRLVEMLLERGAKTVVAFDILLPGGALATRFSNIQKKTGGKIIVLSQSEGDICCDTAVAKAFQVVSKIDVVYHIAALVGPFHPENDYYRVNYEGTLKIIKNCLKYNVPKLVFSSSPSTRFTGSDIEGLREDQMPIPKTFLAHYAKTKAMGEDAVRRALCEDLLTISIAPHQVYGPHDPLFLPNFLEAAGDGLLRIFGNGENKISLCHVDNYCHGLICGAEALYAKSPALGSYYVVTDDEPQYIWKILNNAIVAMGFTDLTTKWHLPVYFLYVVAYVGSILTKLSGKHFKLTPFNVKMMTMNRYFDITNGRRDLKYEPVVTFDKGWRETVEWFKVHWLPNWKNKRGIFVGTRE